MALCFSLWATALEDLLFIKDNILFDLNTAAQTRLIRPSSQREGCSEREGK